MKAAASSCVLLHPSSLRPHPLEVERRARAPVDAGRAESPVVEDRREVVARRDEAEARGDAPAEAPGGDERELVVRYHERAQDVFDLRAALVAVRVGVGGEQVERARGRDVAGKLQPARQAAARVEEAAEEAAERVVRRVAESDDLLQARVEVGRRQARAARAERLFNPRVEGYGAFGREPRVAERAEEAAEKRGAEAFEERRLAVGVADVRAQLRPRRAEE